MRRNLLLLIGLIAWSGCREADRPSGPVLGGWVAVDSDPQGARIFVEGEERPQLTPDTLRDVPVGTRDITVRLDSAGVPYGFGARIDVPDEGIVDVFGPLLVRCASDACFQQLTDHHRVNTVRFAASATGELFYVDGSGGGLYWPHMTQNSYASTGGAIFGGVWSASSDRVAMGAYAFQDQFGNIVDYLTGRPAPRIEHTASEFSLEQSAWVLPPGGLVILPTVRGLEIEQVVTGRPDVDGVLLVQLTFRNITDNPAYQRLDPQPEAGVAYTSAYVGFVLDPDIGEASDDLVSYDPDLGMVFAYDSDLEESGFQAGWADRPGLLGVRVLEAPTGANALLTAWPRSVDWQSGTVQEENGAAWLAGQQDQLGSNFPDHPDARVGYAPTTPADYRIAVSAGPILLAPGDSARLTVALVIEQPEPGTFTSGQPVPPGDPSNPSRQILVVAEGLRQRAIAAADLLGSSSAFK